MIQVRNDEKKPSAMYDFRITPDDQGIERLRLATRERPPAPPVAPPNPSRAVGDQQQTPQRRATRRPSAPGQRRSEERRSGSDRRRGERRVAQQPVVLDTRSPQDRRRGERREQATTSPRGIDLFA